jgi:Raf kinase inhibitor-like YbhB/YbcL family protein
LRDFRVARSEPDFRLNCVGRCNGQDARHTAQSTKRRLIAASRTHAEDATMRPILFSLCSILVLSMPVATRADGFTLESASFGSNTMLDTKYIYNEGECNGGNTSPELHWSGAPDEAKSFAVTMFDPDAGDGAGWWHWLLFDIDAKTTSLPAGAPEGFRGVSGKNSFGETGYGGPCPPRNDKPHRYVFTVYALRTDKLGLEPGAGIDAVKKALEENTLLSVSLQATYER